MTEKPRMHHARILQADGSIENFKLFNIGISIVVLRDEGAPSIVVLVEVLRLRGAIMLPTAR
jgi:hypothetical protein